MVLQALNRPPPCVQSTQGNDSHIGSDAFYILEVPGRATHCVTAYHENSIRRARVQHVAVVLEKPIRESALTFCALQCGGHSRQPSGLQLLYETCTVFRTKEVEGIAQARVQSASFTKVRERFLLRPPFGVSDERRLVS